MSTGYVLNNDSGVPDSVDCILATVGSIDLKTTGQTVLYTVPAGKTLIVTDILIKLVAVDTLTVPATVRAGTSGRSYSDWVGATALTNQLASGDIISLRSASLLPVQKSFAATEVVQLDVTVGATATTCIAVAFVTGILY